MFKITNDVMMKTLFAIKGDKNYYHYYGAVKFIVWFKKMINPLDDITVTVSYNGITVRYCYYGKENAYEYMLIKD